MLQALLEVSVYRVQWAALGGQGKTGNPNPACDASAVGFSKWVGLYQVFPTAGDLCKRERQWKKRELCIKPHSYEQRRAALGSYAAEIGKQDKLQLG